MAIYPPESSERRFWVGRALSAIPVDGNRRKHCHIEFYTDVEGTEYLEFVKENVPHGKLPYSTLLGRLEGVSSDEGMVGHFVISVDERERYSRIGKELDKEITTN